MSRRRLSLQFRALGYGVIAWSGVVGLASVARLGKSGAPLTVVLFVAGVGLVEASTRPVVTGADASRVCGPGAPVHLRGEAHRALPSSGPVPGRDGGDGVVTGRTCRPVTYCPDELEVVE